MVKTKHQKKIVGGPTKLNQKQKPRLRSNRDVRDSKIATIGLTNSEVQPEVSENVPAGFKEFFQVGDLVENVSAK